MKNLCTSVLIACVSLGLVGVAQEKNIASATSLIEILANAEKFDGKKVAVMGFLVIERDALHFRSTLFLHEEDAKQLLIANSVLILATDEMQKDWEKISNAYVGLVGRVQVVPLTDGGRIIQIRDIERCLPWPIRSPGIR